MSLLPASFTAALSLVVLLLPAAGAPAPRVLAWDEAVASRKLALASGETAVEITGMHPLKRTPPIRAGGAGPLMLRALDKAGPDGKPAERPCPIPDTLAYPLILVLPDEGHPMGVRALVIDDNPNGFQWGTYRFVNTTPREFLIRMENKITRIPQGWKPTDVNLGGETRGVGVMIAVPEATERPIYSSVWEYNKATRTLCFLVPGTDPRLSPLAVKAVPQDQRSFEADAAPSSRTERTQATP